MSRTAAYKARAGAVAVEAAVVYSVLLFLILGLIVGGMGVFRYQQVACHAREAARYASTRGSDWQKETDQDSPAQDQVLRDAVVPLLAGMDPTKVSIQMEWIERTTGTVIPWDKAAKYPRSLNSANEYVTNSVRVTITYQWSPDLIFGTLYLTSTCELPMTF
jgi:Flp pilus assembly protein TadG